MKKSILATVIITLFIGYSSLKAQCREYIKVIAPSAIAPYTLDGNFFAPVVLEGETVNLKRTFLAGQRYKIMILGMDIWNKKVTITDQDGFVLFRNYVPKKGNTTQCYYTDYEGNEIPCIGSLSWEFTPKQSMNLTITVEIEQKAKRKKDRVQGCLGIVVGFMPADKTKKEETEEE